MTAVASPIPISVAVTELRDESSDVFGRVTYGKERVVVTKHGRPIAVLMPLEDLELIETLEDQVDAQAIIDARNDPENAGESVSWRELKRKAGR